MNPERMPSKSARATGEVPTVCVQRELESTNRTVPVRFNKSQRIESGQQSTANVAVNMHVGTSCEGATGTDTDTSDVTDADVDADADAKNVFYRSLCRL